MPRRAAKLHVTLCTGLEAGDLHAIIGTAQQFLPHTRAIAAQVGGPLVGNKNTGRIYLATGIQQALARAKTDIYLLGYYNLLQSLNELEARELSAILGSSQDPEIAIDELRIMETHDDLCLCGRVISHIRAPNA